MANCVSNDYSCISSSVMLLSINEKYTVLFDIDDYATVCRYQWSVSSNGYACSGAGKKQVLFHRLILNASCESQVDHINRNKLDNRKCNLRLCSATQNHYNKSQQSNCQSGYRGVALNQYGRWVANINQNGKSIFLGSYTTPEDAANAYDSAAAIVAGEFAYRNLPQVPLRPNIFDELKALRRKGRLAPDEYEEILCLWHNGYSYKEIARKVDRSVDSVRRVVNSGQYSPWHRNSLKEKPAAVTIKKRHPNWLTEIQISDIRDYINDGYKSSDIAWAVGCSISAINRLKKGDTYR